MIKPAPFLALLLSLPLAACISFGSKPPPSLLTFSADAKVETGKTFSSGDARSIVIAAPNVPQTLATARVPVHTGVGEVAYLKGAQWVEPPAQMFARVLSDTVSAKTGWIVLSNRQALMSPAARLSGDLREFGIDEAKGEAVVVYDATLLRSEGLVFERRRFEAREPVGAISAVPAGAALGRAANKVASDVADWLKG